MARDRNAAADARRARRDWASPTASCLRAVVVCISHVVSRCRAVSDRTRTCGRSICARIAHIKLPTKRERRCHTQERWDRVGDKRCGLEARA